MRTRPGPLLAELHAHTLWSDGAFSIGQLVDIYGMRGFDVLCVTDHTVRSDDPWLDEAEYHDRGVTAAVYDEYLAEIEHEAERARSRYDLLLIPGLELTYNALDADDAAHAVAVGLRGHVSVDSGIGEAMRTARAAGAAVIAAHPFDTTPYPDVHPGRLTRGFVRDRALRPLAHRFELFNRTHLFSWVANASLPVVACGDFHRHEHIGGWKTLIPCAKDEGAVLSHLRSPRPVYLTYLGGMQHRRAA